jgi:hypothetical protein
MKIQVIIRDLQPESPFQIIAAAKKTRGPEGPRVMTLVTVLAM